MQMEQFLCRSLVPEKDKKREDISPPAVLPLWLPDAVWHRLRPHNAFGCIYIPVAQNVRYKVNIAGFLIKSRTVGAAQLMRGDLFVVVISREYFFTRFSMACTPIRFFWEE